VHVVEIVADGSPGGGTTVVEALSRRLVEAGHKVTLVTQTNSVLNLTAPEGIDSIGMDFGPRRQTLKTARALKSIILSSSRRADIVHVHGARAGVAAALARLPAPIVYTVHGFHYRKKPAMARSLGKLGEWLSINAAQHVVFVGNDDAQFGHAEHLLPRGKAWSIIRNGVDVGSVRARGWNEREFDMAFVGRMHPQKSPEMLLDVLMAMRPQHPTLLLAGDGPLVERLRKRIAQLELGHQVTQRPAVSHQQAIGLIASARVFLLPSLWEGVPVAAVEAMQVGVPVVASAIPGISELIMDRRTGLLAEVGNVEQFATAVRWILGNPEATMELTQAAQRVAHEEYSTNRQLEEHLKVYASLLRPAAVGR
jgi:glycosyltransferase involved in cell wall biosynthesis